MAKLLRVPWGTGCSRVMRMRRGSMDGCRGKEAEVAKMNQGWADRYRDLWKWDSVTWGTHSVDCYPGGCPFRVYARDGRILREEQSGSLPPIEPGIPDMNPMGCQKGACWSHCH